MTRRTANIIQEILLGMKSGIAKPINYCKVREIAQEEKENPVSFNDRLEEFFRKYTSTDPSSRQEEALLSHRFIAHSAPDIRRKLQNYSWNLRLIRPSC
jgi:hypothetical protein